MPRKIGLFQLAVIVLFGGVGVLAQSTTNSSKAKVTLHDQAKKAGGKLVLKYKTNRGTVYPNVEELAKRSDLIVIGRILSHKSNLTTNERFVTQDFLVKVQEVIKGDLARGRSLLISFPGGRFRFPDGVYAAVMPVGYRQPEDNGIYVFFLKSQANNSVFKGPRLVSESQGLFALTKGTVEPATLADDDPVSIKYRKMDAASFLKKIHQVVPRKKK